MNDGTSTRRKKVRRIAAVTIGLLMSAGFLVLLFRNTDLDAVWSELGKVHAGRLALSLVTMGAGFAMMSGRTGILMAPLRRLSPLVLFKSVMVGFAGNNLLPLRAGELLRMDYLASRGGIAHSSALAVVGVERLLDLFCLALLFFALLPVAVVPLPSTAVVGLLAVVVSGVLGALFAVQRRPEALIAVSRWALGWAGERVSNLVAEKVGLATAGLRSLGSVSRILAAFACTLGFWGFSLTTVHISIWAFDLSLPWYGAGVVVVFAALAVAIPASPGFVGTYHYAVALGLGLMGPSKDVAASFALLMHTMGVVPYTLVALLVLLGDILRGEATARRTSDPSPEAG